MADTPSIVKVCMETSMKVLNKYASIQNFLIAEKLKNVKNKLGLSCAKLRIVELRVEDK